MGLALRSSHDHIGGADEPADIRLENQDRPRAGSDPKGLPASRVRAGVFGTHDEVREHYGTAPGLFSDHATTLDYVVAAAAG